MATPHHPRKKEKNKSAGVLSKKSKMVGPKVSRSHKTKLQWHPLWCPRLIEPFREALGQFRFRSVVALHGPKQLLQLATG